jgi:predicted DNA-binding protein
MTYSGPGEVRMNPKTLTVGVSIYMPVAMYTALRELSHEQRQPLSELVRNLIEKGLKQKKYYAVEPSNQIRKEEEPKHG